MSINRPQNYINPVGQNENYVVFRSVKDKPKTGFMAGFLVGECRG